MKITEIYTLFLKHKKICTDTRKIQKGSIFFALKGENFNGNQFKNPQYDPNRKGRNARHQFTAYLGITGYPTVAFFDENANYLAPIVGYHNVQQMEFYLKLFSSNDYKKLKSPKIFSKPKIFFDE